MNGRAERALVVLLLGAACKDPGPVEVRPVVLGSRPGTAMSELRSTDLAMKMRLRLRSQNEETLRRSITRGGNIVTVAFRSPGKTAGVSRFGHSLLSQEAASAYSDTVAEAAGEVVYRFKHIPAVVVRVNDPANVLALRNRPWIDYIHGNSTEARADDVWQCFYEGTPTSSGSPTDPEVLPWQVTKVRADSVWVTTTGDIDSDRALVLFDDGVDEASHTFGQYLPAGPDLYANEYAIYDTTHVAYEGLHGTAVVGVAAARWNSIGTIGIAPNAPTRIARIAWYTDSSTSAIDWTSVAIAVDNEVEFASVMSLSWSNVTSNSTPPEDLITLYSTILNAYYDYDVVFLNSTGNTSNSGKWNWPAAFPEVVGVGGTSLTGDTAVYNNYGEGNVEISAPAQSVVGVCKGGKTGTVSGTSYATPVAAGVFMLLREAHPSETAAQLRYRVRQTATTMASFQRSGYGLINAKAAVNYQYTPPPLSVTIVGQPSVASGISCTWWAIPSGGTGSYSYAWKKNGSAVGGDIDYLTTSNSGSSFTLQVTVNDGLSPPAIDSFVIEIQSGAYCE